MKKVLAVLLAVLLCCGTCTVGLSAAAAAAQRMAKTMLIVELAGEPGSVRAQAQKNTVQAVQAAAHGAKPVYTYTSVLNAVAIEAPRGDAAAIAQIDGVQAVYDVGGVCAAAEQTPQGSLISSGEMIGVDALHEAGVDGTGTAIAVIDGGLEWDHEAMTLSDPSSAKYTRDGIADVLRSHTMNCAGFSANDVYKSAKVPFAFDYCDRDTIVRDFHSSDPDHGTHVSGIAAGNSVTLRGVAPEAQILMFKIDVYEDEPFLQNLLAALDDAAKFDVAAINMSVGLDFEMPDDPAYELLCKAVTNARNAGITVCAAAGNSGVFSDDVLNPDNGTNGIPNSIPDVTSVASVDNVNLSEPVVLNISAVRFDNREADVLGYSSLAFPRSGEYVPIGAKDFSGSSEGKVALVCDPNADVSKYLKGEAWLGVIVGESALDLVYSEIMDDIDEMNILVIGDVDAYRMRHAKARTFELVYDSYYAEPADILRSSDYTGYGVSGDLKLTVDLAAPGGVIYSSVSGGQYDIYDGTSMASPHAAGSAALLEQYISKAFPGVTGRDKADLKESLLCSTADPVTIDDVPISPRAVGAGLINLREATAAKAMLRAKDGCTALNLGDGIDDTMKMTFTVRNVSEDTVRYDTLKLDVITDAFETYKLFDETTGTYSTASRITGESVPLRYSIVQSDMPRSIVLRAGESASVTFTVQLDKTQLAENAAVFTNGFYVEGYLYLTDSMSDSTPLNMPFMGFCGDWKAIPSVSFSDIYDDFFGMKFFLGAGLSVNRNLRSLSFTLVDADGRECGTYTEDYVTKGTLYTDEEFPGLFADVDTADGMYTLLIRAVPDIPDAAEQVIERDRQIRIDKTPPTILRVQTSREKNGSAITITCDSDDLDYFEVNGATLLNRKLYDLIPVDGYDRQDAEGHYVYVLHTDKTVRGRLVVIAKDLGGNTDEWGRYSLMRIIFAYLASLPIQLYIWFLQRFYGFEIYD